jgi:hypothetical protein
MSANRVFPLLFCSLFISLPAMSSVIWQENFESYNLSLDNLEDQGVAAGGAPTRDWLTDPMNTPAIGVIATTGLGFPASFGSNVLAVGGIDPGETDSPGVSFLISPSAVFYSPTIELPGVRLDMDMSLNSAGLGRLTDSFRLSFFDSELVELATITFSPGQNDLVAVSRFNGTSVFNTQAILATDSVFSLELLINPVLNKWTGTIIPQVGSAFSIFANVDMTTQLNEKDFGGFAIDWFKSSSPSWGDNTLLVDNLVLTAIPEPSTILLSSILSCMVILLRRR